MDVMKKDGSSPALAASKSPVEQRYAPNYNKCLNSGQAAEGVTSAMVECNVAETRIQDGRLNQAYKMVMTRLPANRKDQLRLSERNWIKARDAGCILDETIKRTMFLERYR